jgi:SAM-dependent methyltransferase
MKHEAYLEMADTEDRHWWFCARRAILSSVIETLPLGANARILEVGAGTGGNLDMLSSFGTVSAFEMDATARLLAAEKTAGKYDIREGCCPTNIPFVGEKFDLICLFDVLEHIEEDEGTLIALKDFLSDEGRVLLTVPANRWLWSAHDVSLHHKRRYSVSELRAKVLSAGYGITKLSFFNTFLFPVAAMMRCKDKLTGNTISASGTAVPPAMINRLFGTIFGCERLILRHFDFPFGVSLICIFHVGR